jgi:hypothetical protein
MTTQDTLRVLREIRQQVYQAADTLDGRLLEEAEPIRDNIEETNRWLSMAIGELDGAIGKMVRE